MKLTVQAAGTFEVGKKVGLHHRLGDYAGDHGAHLGDAIASATVQDDGSVSFSSNVVVPGGRYWVGGRDVHGRFRSVSVTAADPAQDTATFDQHDIVDPDVQAQLRKQMQPPSGTISNVVEGARSTVDARGKKPVDPVVAASSLPQLHEPQKTPDPTQPVGQADESGPQRSSTPMGTATPVDPSEPDTGRVPASESEGPQRSDTPLGHTTPVDPGEVQPGLPQEEAHGPQKSDTPLGTEAPVEPRELDLHGPPGTQVRREQFTPSERKPKRSKSPARNKAGSKSSAKTKRARTKSAQTKAQRSAAAKKAAATRKANAAKKGGK